MVDGVDAGFSRKAAVYDAYCASNAAVQWSLGIIRTKVLQVLPAGGGGSILEINAGTGRDAAWFAERGHCVHATDIAAGMVAEIERKISTGRFAGRLTCERVSFNDLSTEKFDLIFSNFGGLNCAHDLRAVCSLFRPRLNPHGYVVLVVMPRICPWELVQVFRGRLGVATRRLGTNGTIANVEGARVPTRYFSAGYLNACLGDAFEILELRSLGLVSPPSFMEGFPRRWPMLFAALARVDARVGTWPLARGWGDYMVLSARLK